MDKNKKTNKINGLFYCILSALSLIGLILLIVFSSIKGNSYTIVSFSIYGVTILLFSIFLTLYYWIYHNQKSKIIFKKFALITSSLLILGTFLPICLCTLRGPLGWSIFGIIIAFTIFEIILYSIWTNIPKILPIILLSILPFLFYILFIFISLKTNNINVLLILSNIFSFLAFISYLLKNIKLINNINSNFIFSNICIILSIITYYFYTLFYTILY